MTAAESTLVTLPAPGRSRAVLTVEIDPVEHARRRAAGLGAVTDMAVLAFLFALPEGLPVPLASLPEPVNRTVRRMPAGVVSVTGEQVVRHAVRPCRVQLATVHGSCSATDMEQAGSFAPFCARRVVTAVRPQFPETLIEYDFWGVGITLESPDGEETLVEPRRWMPKRHTPAGWRFVETVYAKYLTSGGAL
jgi:hypothetical protein